MRRYRLVVAVPQCPYDLGDFLGHVSFVVLSVQVVQVQVAVKVFGQVNGVTEALNYAVHVARIAEVLEPRYPWMLKTKKFDL